MHLTAPPKKQLHRMETEASFHFVIRCNLAKQGRNQPKKAKTPREANKIEKNPHKNFPIKNKKPIFALRKDDSVAQLVEQMTLNHWVVSSSLTGVTQNQRITKVVLFFYGMSGMVLS